MLHLVKMFEVRSFQTGWAITDARSKIIHYKIVHRYYYQYYYSPSKMFKMGLLQNDHCWKCGNNVGLNFIQSDLSEYMIGFPTLLYI